jgi:hypothetical protein
MRCRAILTVSGAINGKPIKLTSSTVSNYVTIPRNNARQKNWVALPHPQIIHEN